MLALAARIVDSPRHAALALALAAAATLAGAWLFELAGYLPCPLCLEQRRPYYAAIPVALLAAWLAGYGGRVARIGLVVLAGLFLYNAGLGAYHAGAEWGFWQGPADCAGGGALPGPGQMGNFMQTLQATRVISCTEPAIRILGLSLAGWNVLISLALAAFAMIAAFRPAQGSSSLSQ